MLSELRNLYKMDVATFAHKTHLSKERIVQIENGEDLPNIEEQKAITKALNIPHEYGLFIAINPKKIEDEFFKELFEKMKETFLLVLEESAQNN